MKRLSCRMIVVLAAASYIAVLAFEIAPIQAQEPGPPPAVTQSSELKFTERDPQSSIREQAKRFNWQMSWVKQQDPDAGEYDLSRESFRVHVPADWDRDSAAGLFVWVSPSQSGEIPAEWRPVLDRYKLIAIGADNSGNHRLVWYRMGLALDAVFNMKKRYKIDEQRVYIAGFSGGARMASRLGMQYPDVFQGGLYMGACDYFRRVPVPDNPKSFWPEAFPAPTGKRAELVKKERRHVFLVGANDPNHAPTKAFYEQAQNRDKFAHALFIEMPGVAHTMPNANYLDQAIRYLNQSSTNDPEP
jgi:hypothetical protein